MENKNIKKPGYKCVASAILFHILYSFIFGMLINVNNPMEFLLTANAKNTFMVLTAIFAALPYVIAGYLITLSRNGHQNLKEKNQILFLRLAFPILIIYIITLVLQSYFKFRNMYLFLFFIDYPVTSHLLLMEFSDYSQNLLVMFITLLPSIMVYLGGLIRIRQLGREGYNE